MSKATHVAVIALFLPLAACAGSTDTTETTETTTPAGAAVPTPAQDEVQAAELARVTTSTGTTVGFFEPAPGQVLVLESGPVGTVAALTAANLELPLSALFRDISGARDVPSALLAAEQREAEVQAHLPLEANKARRSRAEAITTYPALPAQMPVTVPSSTLSGGGSCSATTFLANGGCVGGGNKSWCLLDWWNGAWEAVSSTDLSQATACADIGSFVFHAATGNGSVVDWSVLQGYWAQYNFHYGPQTSLRYEIRNASGSRFQFGGNFYWY